MKYRVSPPQRRRLRMHRRHSVILRSDDGVVLEVFDPDQTLEGDYSAMVTCGFLVEAEGFTPAPPQPKAVQPAPVEEADPELDGILPKPPMSDDTHIEVDEMREALASLKAEAITIEENEAPSAPPEEPVTATTPDPTPPAPRRRKRATKAPEAAVSPAESEPEAPKKKPARKRRTRKKTT